MKYEKIKEATIVLALDNGAINRHRSLAELLNDLKAFLATKDSVDLVEANRWLGTLSEAQMDTFMSGSDEEIDAIQAPEAVDDLFNQIFEKVL